MQTITEIIYHDLPSDGVVTSNSQRNVGGGWWGTIREASNISHREFRSVNRIDPTMTWVLDRAGRPDIFRISNN